MRKAVTAVAAAATLAAATLATPSSADARRGWWGPAIIGGIAAGAIVGSALASPYGYYGGHYAPAPVYYDYYTPAPAYYSYYGAPGYYGPRPYHGCWRWRYGYRYRVC
jgi:hypothetical protein